MSLEDVIDDAADAAVQELTREAAENQAALWMFQMPEETAAVLNILVNRVETRHLFQQRL